MVVIHPQKIEGNWEAGIALDFHTTSSVFTGYDESGHPKFDTTRPEIAELLYRLKYQNDQTVATGIMSAAAGFLLPHVNKFDFIVPVPPSAQRLVQPVLVLASGIGKMLNKPVLQCVTTTRTTAQLKSVADPEQRRELVAGLYAVNPSQTTGRNVLLFDDLFRSGTTLNAITDVLRSQGRVASVRAFTITKTRNNR